MDIGGIKGLNTEFVFDKIENGDASALFYITLLLLLTADTKRNPRGFFILQENFDDIELAEYIKEALDAEPGRRTINRIQAAISGLTSDAFEVDPEAHLIITAGLLGYDPSEGVVNEVSFEDVIVSSLELALISGEPTQTSASVEALQMRLADAAGFDPEEFGDEGLEDINDAKVLVLFAAEYMRKIEEELRSANFPEYILTALRDNFQAEDPA